MNGSEAGLLSICCLGYCHANYLSDAINSICKIGYDKIEVIVVDDGSLDDSVAVLEALSATVPFNMIVISQSNTGNVGLNFNTAFRRASGEFVSFISLDDVYNSEIMTKQIDVMNADSELAFVASSKTVSIDDSGLVTNKAAQLPLLDLDCPDICALLELEYTDFGSFYIQSAIFRKVVIDAVGAFDEDMTGDDIVLRTKVFRYIQSQSRWKFRVLRDSSFFYRLHGSNIHRNFIRQTKIVTEYLDRYWPERATPELLVDWAYSYVSDNRFEDCIGLFSLNSRTAALLSNPRIISGLRRSMKNELSLPNRFGRFLYSRIKLENERRRVVLLGCISFEYSRAKKAKKLKHGEALKHFSEYS